MLFRLTLCLLIAFPALGAKAKKKCVPGPIASHVAEPVPGLLAAIPSTLSDRPGPTAKERKNPPRVALTPEISVSDRMGWEDTYDDRGTKNHTVTSKPWFKDPETGTEVEGMFKLGYNERTKTFIIDQVFLDFLAQDKKTEKIVAFPHWINQSDVPPLVDGKGVPAGMFLSLRAAKILRVPTGEPLNVVIKDIRDFATLSAFETAKRDWVKKNPAWAKANKQKETWQMRTMIPDDVKSELLRNSHSVSFAEGLLAQMGLRVKSVKFVSKSASKGPPDYQHDVGTLVSLRLQKDYNVPWKVAPQMEKFKEQGLKKTDRIESDFNIVLETEPIP